MAEKTWKNINGVNKEVVPWINVSGSWKKCVPWVNVNGVWKKCYSAGGSPSYIKIMEVTTATDSDPFNHPLIRLAQTFTALSNVQGSSLLSVRVMEGGRHHIGNNTGWQIYNTGSNGNPANAISDMVTVVATDWPLGGWKDMTFPLYSPLEANKVYALVGRAITIPEGNYLYWAWTSPNTYSGGRMYCSDDGGQTWGNYPSICYTTVIQALVNN